MPRGSADPSLYANMAGNKRLIPHGWTKLWQSGDTNCCEQFASAWAYRSLWQSDFTRDRGGAIKRPRWSQQHLADPTRRRYPLGGSFSSASATQARGSDVSVSNLVASKKGSPTERQSSVGLSIPTRVSFSVSVSVTRFRTDRQLTIASGSA